MRPPHCFVLSTQAHLKQRLCIISSFHVWSAHSNYYSQLLQIIVLGFISVFAASKACACNQMLIKKTDPNVEISVTFREI